jgi:hypothetical protein
MRTMRNLLSDYWPLLAAVAFYAAMALSGYVFGIGEGS